MTHYDSSLGDTVIFDDHDDVSIHFHASIICKEKKENFTTSGKSQNK